MVGNVGDRLGNITLMPKASADDGLIDVYLASPHRPLHWLKLGARMVLRRSVKDDPVDDVQGRTVRLRVLEGGKPEKYQLDGDVVGECSRFTAEVQPGALTLCLPQPAVKPKIA